MNGPRIILSLSGWLGRRLAVPAAVALAAGVAACTTVRPGDEGSSVSEQPAAAPIRAMTFNIRYGTAPEDEHAWPERRGLVVRVIRDFAPSVLGLQEALRFQLDEIRRELPRYDEIGVGRDDGAEEGEYSAILFDRRRLELLGQGTFWLSDTPALPGSMSWGNRLPRIATWGRFRDRTTDDVFYVFNTHWDHESQPARERSAELLLERIRQREAPAAPMLLLGDFNAGEDSHAFQTLLAAPDDPPGALRLYDTFRAVHPDARETGTYHGFRGERTGAKIDAILASPRWRTLDAAILRLHEDGRYPSDHFPVTATVAFRAGDDRR